MSLRQNRNVCLLMACLLALTFAYSCVPMSLEADSVLVEAEQFETHGGWVLDQQFMDMMGSPFMLAHGMGTPVEDAKTTVDFQNPGTYQVWVRTRDWVAPWRAPGTPGKFQLIVDGQPLTTTFGTEGEAWHWQSGGEVTVGKKVHLTLHDLTGFEGRCDAIIFSNEKGWTPPNEPDALVTFRQKALGLTADPIETNIFDLVVVGGGMAGTAAAVTAARQGLSVALIQDRPVLGGNSSSEVRVWPEGHVNQLPYPRVGDVVMELVPKRRKDSKNAQNADVFDDDRKLRVVEAEPNITLFLEQRMNAVQAEKGSIQSVVCQHVRSAVRTKIRGQLFLDSTGDGSLGFLAGADFDQTDKKHMGASNLWNIKCLCEDEDPLSSELQAACENATFPRCPWAVDLTDKPFPGRTDGKKLPQLDAGNKPISLGNWFWESGFDRDPIKDMERVRDQNFRAMYGAWDAIKNVEKRYPAHRLNWVAYIAGKRESRRLLGDVILTAEDLRDGNQFVDGCFPCTWGIDTHFPAEKYKQGHAGDEFIADFTHGEGYTYKGPYWVPYRCLYSRNVDNLFMAGRDISVTHEALGAVRVMKTTGSMGEIVGMAAAVCKDQKCRPREVYTTHLSQLQNLMEIGSGKHVHQVANADNDFVMPASQAIISGRQLRYEPSRDALGYWRSIGDEASWIVKVEQAGQYALELEMSCAEKESGGTFEVIVGNTGKAVTFQVDSTKDWNHFVAKPLGTYDLPVGVHPIRIRSKKKVGPLMKLRSATLSEN
ncbi:MAG: FAD-dependent oxidoreductase [Pirellulaceae bacterium]|nr:FAD-dependent oxidoreductase [Pirellulaceae bacterium]